MSADTDRHAPDDALLADFIADCLVWIKADPHSLEPAMLTGTPGAMAFPAWCALSDADKFVFFQYALRGSLRGASLRNRVKSCAKDVQAAVWGGEVAP